MVHQNAPYFFEIRAPTSNGLTPSHEKITDLETGINTAECAIKISSFQTVAFKGSLGRCHSIFGENIYI